MNLKRDLRSSSDFQSPQPVKKFNCDGEKGGKIDLDEEQSIENKKRRGRRGRPPGRRNIRIQHQSSSQIFMKNRMQSSQIPSYQQNSKFQKQQIPSYLFSKNSQQPQSITPKSNQLPQRHIHAQTLSERKQILLQLLGYNKKTQQFLNNDHPGLFQLLVSQLTNASSPSNSQIDPQTLSFILNGYQHQTIIKKRQEQFFVNSQLIKRDSQILLQIDKSKFENENQQYEQEVKKHKYYALEGQIRRKYMLYEEEDQKIVQQLLRRQKVMDTIKETNEKIEELNKKRIRFQREKRIESQVELSQGEIRIKNGIVIQSKQDSGSQEDDETSQEEIRLLSQELAQLLKQIKQLNMDIQKMLNFLQQPQKI